MKPPIQSKVEWYHTFNIPTQQTRVSNAFILFRSPQPHPRPHPHPNPQSPIPSPTSRKSESHSIRRGFRQHPPVIQTFTSPWQDRPPPPTSRPFSLVGLTPPPPYGLILQALIGAQTAHGTLFNYTGSAMRLRKPGYRLSVPAAVLSLPLPWMGA